MITARGSPFTTVPVTNLWCLLLWSSVWIFFVIIFMEVTSDHRHKQKETRRVVTVRVVNKGGWCTAGEIDSYLDENEAWCLWGEEGSFSIHMNRSFKKKKVLNYEKNERNLMSVENGVECGTCSFVKLSHFTLKIHSEIVLWNIFETVGIDTAALMRVSDLSCWSEEKYRCLYWWIWIFSLST